MSMETKRQELDRVRRKYSMGTKGSRSEVMAAADAYALAVLEEARQKADPGIHGLHTRRAQRFGRLRARIKRLGKRE